MTMRIHIFTFEIKLFWCLFCLICVGLVHGKQAKRKCVYRFTVPLSDVDLTCPGGEVHGGSKNQATPVQTEESNSVPRYAAAQQMNPYEAYEARLRQDYELERRYHRDQPLMDSAQALVGAMAQLMDRRSQVVDMDTANKKIEGLQESLKQQEQKYEDLTAQTQLLQSQLHMLVSGMELSQVQTPSTDQTLKAYAGQTSLLSCPINAERGIYQISAVKSLYDRAIDIVPRSCYEWNQRGYSTSGNYYVDLDGFEGLLPMLVFCDMSTTPPATCLLHNYYSNRTHVNGFEEPGSYQIFLKYDITQEHMYLLLNQSTSCEQKVTWECKGASLSFQSHWVDRSGNRHDYWPGANPEQGGCACNVHNNCSLGRRCNCDTNDGSRWLEDSGYVKNKTLLPVSSVGVGDTGGKDEEGYLTVGPVKCFTTNTHPLDMVSALVAVSTWPPQPTYCTTDGWMVIQRKYSREFSAGETKFQRDWDSYKNGFGSLEGEFWLGLESMHRFTASRWRPMALKVVLETTGQGEGFMRYALYENFYIGSEEEKYSLHIGRYLGGTLSDELSKAQGRSFSTYDQDNDRYDPVNCAALGGGWWFTDCGQTHLNDEYMAWGRLGEVKYVELRIKPVQPK